VLAIHAADEEGLFIVMQNYR